MKLIAVNGSPRKDWNTATLLRSALDGAASQGAETELFHLYDLTYKGCISCFSCKKKEGKHYGTCAVKDDITPVMDKIYAADAFIFGSPIYLGSLTGEMRSFIERLLFQKLIYASSPPLTLYTGKLKTAGFYTMNVDEERFKELGYPNHLGLMESFFNRIFGHSESLYCYDTYQFKDYSQYVQSAYDPEKKAARRKEVFPKDCEKAFEIGKQFATTD